MMQEETAFFAISSVSEEFPPVRPRYLPVLPEDPV